MCGLAIGRIGGRRPLPLLIKALLESGRKYSNQTKKLMNFEHLRFYFFYYRLFGLINAGW